MQNINTALFTRVLQYNLNYYNIILVGIRMHFGVLGQEKNLNKYVNINYDKLF